MYNYIKKYTSYYIDIFMYYSLSIEMQIHSLYSFVKLFRLLQSFLSACVCVDSVRHNHLFGRFFRKARAVVIFSDGKKLA